MPWGRKVLTQIGGVGKNDIILKSESNGVYFLHLFENTHINTYKLIIDRSY